MIDDILISDELLESYFVCKLDACKGACCYEGDFGAPLSKDELPVLTSVWKNLKNYLDPAAYEIIQKSGPYKFYREMQSWGTQLRPDGSCVFMIRDEKGIAKCGIEQAWKDGKTDFQKPISCHLYPVRVNENPKRGFTALNYDTWDICKAACRFGEENKMPLFRFVKSALIRRFGEEFYNQLEAAYEEKYSGLKADIGRPKTEG